jgi:hypothetical protein
VAGSERRMNWRPSFIGQATGRYNCHYLTDDVANAVRHLAMWQIYLVVDKGDNPRLSR